MGALNRSVVAPLSSAIITVMLAGLVVAGVDSLNQANVEPGTARIEPTGVVEISVAGGPFTRASHGRTLRANDAVRVIDGRAVLELPDASKLEMRDGSALTIRGAASPSVALDEGDLLVEADQGDTVGIDGGTSVISVAGSAKLRRGVSLAAGVYEGTARIHRNDQGLTVPKYRQAAVVGTGILPEAPVPLNLAPSDEWDRRLMGTVMALDEQLDLFAKSFEAAVPPAPAPDFFKQVAPKVAPLPITAELLNGRAPGENLIGLNMVAVDEGPFGERFSRVFGFRSQGASWGLVAADRGVNSSELLGDLEAVLNNLGGGPTPDQMTSPDTVGGLRPINIGGRIGALPSGGGSSTDRTGGTGGTAPTAPATGGTGTAGTGTGGSGGSGTPSPSPSPNPGPSPSPKVIDVPPTGTFLDPVLTPVVEPVEDLLSGVLGGLLGQPATGSGGTGSTAPLSPVTSPIGTAPATVPTSPTGTVSVSGSTTTPTTAPPAPTTTSGLLGGIVGGLNKTVGGLL